MFLYLLHWLMAEGLMIPRAFAQGGNLFFPRGSLHLLQPLDDQTFFLPSLPGIGIFFAYFNLFWPWILGVAAGVAVLQVLVGGIQIMMAGGGDQASDGKTRVTWALAGLVLIVFVGFILRLLNNLAFL